MEARKKEQKVKAAEKKVKSDMEKKQKRAKELAKKKEKKQKEADKKEKAAKAKAKETKNKNYAALYAKYNANIRQWPVFCPAAKTQTQFSQTGPAATDILMRVMQDLLDLQKMPGRGAANVRFAGQRK